MINNAWDIRRQTLWYNTNIRINCTYVFNGYRKWYENGIKIIHDIIDERGNFLSVTALEEKTGQKINFMLYNSLKDAIPVEWRKTLKTLVVSQDAVSARELPHITIKANVDIPLTIITNKDIYWMLTNTKVIEPNCKLTWNLAFDVKNLWSTIFKLPFKTVRETKIQSFQYKIINRIFPCNYYVSKFKKDISDKCEVCNDYVDTLEHYFFYCNSVKIFWNSFSRWFTCLTNENINIEVKDVIFGFLENTTFNHVLNFCIYYAKWHLYRQKLQGKEIFLHTYLVEMKHILEIEEYIHKINNSLYKFEMLYGIVFNAM